MEKIDLIIFILTVFKAVSSDFVVIQQGSSYTFEYSESKIFYCDTFNWSHKNIAIQSCFNDNPNINSNIYYTCIQQPFVRQAETNVSVLNAITSTNLTIVDVYKNSKHSDEGLWTFSCNAPPKNITIATFELRLYEKPVNLQCTSEVDIAGLTVSCNCDGIYPKANFYVRRNQSSLGTITTCQNVQDSYHLYYNSKCNFTFPAASIRIGKLYVDLTVYPNVTTLISDTDFGDSRLITLNFDNPSIILTNCQETDIIESNHVSCTCERSDNIDITTNIIWLINGTENFTSFNRSSILSTISSRYVTNYTCVATNVFNWKSIPLMYRPSVLYRSEISYFLINGLNNSTVIIDSDAILIIQCDAVGNPEPSLTLIKDRTPIGSLTNTNSKTQLFWNVTVGCEDSGVYICDANNILGNSQKTSTVLVKCPQQLRVPSLKELVLISTEGNDVSFNISVLGYPEPNIYYLKKDGVKVYNVTKSTSNIDISTKYTLMYKEEHIPYGNITLTIFNMSSDDFANYTLFIYNGERWNLTYMFRIQRGGGSSLRDLNREFNWPALGGGLGAAVLGIFMAVLSCIIFSIRRSHYHKDNLVVICNDDLYWIDVNNAGEINPTHEIPAKDYDMDYVSPITTACSPPGNYENIFNKK